jgi:tRNA-uridine 2-sulfurtransferase
MKEKVLVSLSGGIDSAMTAWLFLQEGYQITGVHFSFFRNTDNTSNVNLELISDTLGIPVIHYDASRLFRDKVINYMTRMHAEGKTPSPCTRCNPEVKWKLLKELAASNKCSYFATGHYVRLRREGANKRIFRGKDLKKDQSYYLWGLTDEQLEHALCPLGDFHKKEIKQMAAENGFGHLVKSKESTGMCFADSRSYNELLKLYLDHPPPDQGDVVDRRGKTIGTHNGYIYYTIGQKKDLKLKDDLQKFCVAAIFPRENLLMADSWENLYRNEFTIGQVHFFNEDELFSGIPVQTMIRGFGLNPDGNTIFERSGTNSFRVKLENPAWAVAPGQPAVFYSGDKLLGGGIVVDR